MTGTAATAGISGSSIPEPVYSMSGISGFTSGSFGFFTGSIFGRTVGAFGSGFFGVSGSAGVSGVTGTAGTLASGSSGRVGTFERSGLFTRSPNPPSGIRIGLTGIFGFTVTGFSGCFGAVYVGGVLGLGTCERTSPLNFLYSFHTPCIYLS